MTDKFEDMVEGSEVGDTFSEPFNMYFTIKDNVKIDTPNHPAYFYVMSWLKISKTVWILHSIDHVSSFDNVS